MTQPRTRAGLVKCRPLRRGSRIALVAPASPFSREEFFAGLDELRRLELEPVFDESVFERQGFVAGPASVRAAALRAAMTDQAIDAVMAVRGGYGSVELLPLLDPGTLLSVCRTAFVGYSDVTAVHTFLNQRAGLVTIHGPMIDRRIAAGPAAYDPASLFACLSEHAVGELSPEGLEAINGGEAAGPLFGGTITQLAASLGTPYAFDPPPGSILLLEDVGERPYRIHRLLTQLRLSGRLERAAAVIVGQLPQCEDEGAVTAGAVVADVLSGFRGPVLTGFPSGHTVTPLVSVPFGVATRVVATGRPRVVIEEAAAA
jgi:muramoyltetrapeptide carboxypeptidase